MQINLKRAYDSSNKEDGYRVLVDRLWPRGISKEKAHINYWDKNIAPSTQLRQWFAHDPAKWADFKRKYTDELIHNKEETDAFIAAIKNHPVVTFVFGAKDTEHNEAVVLKDFIVSHLK